MTAAFAFLVHTNLSMLLPGQAVDLRTVVAVRGHRPPAAHFYLTDVSLLPNVPPLVLIAALEPGARVIKTSDVIPDRIGSERYNRAMVDSMHDSENAAIYVAERAAGYPIPEPVRRVRIVGVLAGSPADGILRPGDIVDAVDGKSARSMTSIQRATAAHRAGDSVRVGVVRGGVASEHVVRAGMIQGRVRLGILLADDVAFGKPPVPVTFTVGDVEGSSGGLMFALEIYRSLRPQPSALHVAGTGTLDADGNVGEIAGTMQKLIAARNAGANIFLVPQTNYAEVKGAAGMRVIPVKTFAQAISALDAI